MLDDQDPSREAEFHSVDSLTRSRSPRFARLVRSPVARRLSPKRLVLGTVCGVGLIWGGSLVGLKCANHLAYWVGTQPEHQIAFDAIKLVPPTPPYITSNAIGILDAVRQSSKYDSSVSVLNTDLEALRVDLSKNPWIEKAGPVRASYRSLTVEVVYRKPLAVVIVDPAKNEAMVIDRHAVELPIENKQFELVESKQQYQIVGDTKCLIQIRGVGSALPNRKGMTWKSADPTIDDKRILEAVDLVQFLYDRTNSKTQQGRPMPDFRVIHFTRQTVRNNQGLIEEVQGFFLVDADERFVFWNSAPHRETKNEPTASEKWTMLAQFIDKNGPLALKLQNSEYLKFTPKVAEIARVRSNNSAAKSSQNARF